MLDPSFQFCKGNCFLAPRLHKTLGPCGTSSEAQAGVLELSPGPRAEEGGVWRVSGGPVGVVFFWAYFQDVVQDRKEAHEGGWEAVWS